jgi:hypothetical protein
MEIYTYTVYRRPSVSGPAKQRKKKIRTNVPAARQRVYGIEISRMHVPYSGTRM